MPIPSFDLVMQDALVRKGGFEALEATLPTPKSSLSLARITDDRWLAMMTKCIFQACYIGDISRRLFDSLDIIEFQQRLEHIQCDFYLVIDRVVINHYR